jgi:hypothetical protein
VYIHTPAYRRFQSKESVAHRYLAQCQASIYTPCFRYTSLSITKQILYSVKAHKESMSIFGTRPRPTRPSSQPPPQPPQPPTPAASTIALGRRPTPQPAGQMRHTTAREYDAYYLSVRSRCEAGTELGYACSWVARQRAGLHQ